MSRDVSKRPTSDKPGGRPADQKDVNVVWEFAAGTVRFSVEADDAR